MNQYAARCAAMENGRDADEAFVADHGDVDGLPTFSDGKQRYHASVDKIGIRHDISCFVENFVLWKMKQF